MKKLHPEAGFTAWELVLVLVVLVGIAVIGFRIYDSHVSTPVVAQKSTTSVVAKSSTTSVPSAPVAVNNSTDLDSASAALNQVDPSSSNAADTSQLNSQTNF